ncbi:adventurous gliding motility protein AgmC [Hyalangium versicolor]|uniref:adventurous gliding motility protein AgmC n=1 Tax=Hyalangium versicolor TaxID=2861190 RepID=UPI0021068EC2|nr:hemagglutinin [Hyalangium versicolor]
MRIVSFLLGLLLSASALAEPDTFWLGSGRNGSLTVNQPNTVVNRYAQLTADAPAGTKALTVSTSSTFTAGELVLLHQSTGLTPSPASGDQDPISLDSSTVGQFEFARVESFSSGTFQLTAPLTHSYPASVTQVVSVPEYTDVQVLSIGSLQARPWDGSMGGILAFLASGTLTNNGLVSVDGAGFRGGAFLNHATLLNCPLAPDLPQADGGTFKGEGLVPGSYGTATGRGNLTSGGGGGNCHNSGGGGGGHGGRGGQGGRAVAPETDAGGLGGAAVEYLPHERLLFGGGGGAGEGNDNVGTGGGAGGGLMIIRAAAVEGSGRFSAKGSSASPTPDAGDDGAGGGGAGGAISLRTPGGLTCSGAESSGGAGGNASNPSLITGPGGGGGGGIAFLQGDPLTCPRVVLAGAPGVSAATGTIRGAGPTRVDAGVSYGSDPSLPVALKIPETPSVTRPADGDRLVEQRPLIEGTAEQDVPVHLFLDGILYAKLEATGSGGSFTYTVTSDLPLGSHELSASAEVLGISSEPSTPNRFEVVARPVLVIPAEGDQVDPTPLLAGTSLSGASVSVEIDDVEVTRLPVGSERRFAYTLGAAQALAPGQHRATIRFWDAAGNPGLASPVTNFEVLDPTNLDVSCGCGTSPSFGLGAAAALLGAWAARRRRGGRWPPADQHPGGS